MKPIRSIAFLLLMMLIASCSNPLEKPFNRGTSEADFTRIVKLGLIDSTEAFIMSHFMVEHDLIDAQVLELGATYEDILKESKTFWERSGGKKKESTTPEISKVDKTLLNDLKFTFQPLPTVLQSEWSHGIKYHITIENTSGKAITAFKGNFVFNDAFGDRVYFIEYKYLEALEANEKVEKDVTLRIQNAAGPQTLLEYGKTNPFVLGWEPDSILYR